MTPFRFGPPNRQMYGAYHSGSIARRPSVGVLLCNPFGQEAIRIHRLYSLLAERLSAEGLHVLRFDYFSTGDSDGEDEQGDLEGWSTDIRTAHAELLRRARCSHSVWMGSRLGAALAALATSPCAEESHPPDRLVLWEPLTDGPTYIRELGRSHARAIEFALAPGAGPVDESLGAEAIGFTVSDELRQQLSMLNLNALVHVCAREVAILSRPEDASAQALVQALQAHGKAVKAGSLRHDLVWSSEEALGAALAPADVLLALQAQIMDSLQ